MVYYLPHFQIHKQDQFGLLEPHQQTTTELNNLRKWFICGCLCRWQRKPDYDKTRWRNLDYKNSTADNSWKGVSYTNEKFIAITSDRTNRVLQSSDGINWTDYAAAANTKLWRRVTYSNDIFVGVSNFFGLGGAGKRVMTSGGFLNNDSFNQLKTISVYPNPTNNILNLTIDTNAKVEIYNLLGKVIAIKNINVGNSKIDLSNYPSGMYLLKVINKNNQTKTIKIAKQ